MAKYDIRPLQMRMLKVLETFDKVCAEHHIRYGIFAGSLIGAVRHKGFIPWDDDMDVLVPRPDYELLIQHSREWLPEPYEFVCAENDPKYPLPFGKLQDASTTLIERRHLSYLGGIYVDVTFGGGGHSREILSRLDAEGHLYGFDQDLDVVKQLDNEPFNQSNFTFVRSNFRYLKNWMRYYGVDHIDGLLADLGVSSHHFDDESRGFSFRFDSPLDMRMNAKAELTAADVVNGYDEKQLADVFYLYGELKNSRRLAAAIVKARKTQTVSTTGQLLDVVEPLFHREREKKDMAKVFQALRIEVNHEMSALAEMLAAATELLGQGGRLSVITYHSLEDRMVKNVIRAGNVSGSIEKDFYGSIQSPLKAVNNKPIVPDEDELQRNPRSRSAKLRIAEKA